MMRKEYVVDACVMVDMLSADEPRHAAALELEAALLAEKALCFSPATLLVEVFAASAQSSRAKGGTLAVGRPNEAVWPFDLMIIHIDLNFVRDYVAPLTKFPKDMPRAGDLPYFFLAMKKRVPLITEDIPLRKIAERWGVQVMTISEALADLGH